MTAGYQPLPGGYEVARLRVGVSLRSPAGQEVYFQPGDDSAAILDTIAALDEVPADRAAVVADIALGDYF